MTNDERAKAYDEVLKKIQPLYEQAKKDGNPIWSTYEYLIPELRESEDEQALRIIKKRMCYDPVPISDEDRRIVENWLEKQKYDRMKPIYDARESFESALEKAWNDYHNGYENVDKLEDDYVECAHAKGFREGYLFGIEKQKEHQNNSDAPNEGSWTGIISSSDKDKNLDEIAQDYVEAVKEYNPEPTWDLMQTAVCYGYHFAEQKEQKPMEWEDIKDKVNVPYCSSEPEWSEEDEHRRQQAINALDRNNYYVLVDWLKSLRPSWKPSEEQMEALMLAIEGKCSPTSYMSRRLEDLYEQLKKL